MRDEQEKSARLAARAAAAAAAKQLATTDTVAIPNTEASTEANEKAALIAAAIARAREQQVTATPQNMQQLSAEQLAEISAIEARRAEIREQAKPHLPPDA